jgi:hypothetical protein
MDKMEGPQDSIQMTNEHRFRNCVNYTAGDIKFFIKFDKWSFSPGDKVNGEIELELKDSLSAQSKRTIPKFTTYLKLNFLQN